MKTEFNEIFVKIANVEKQKGDVVLNWATHSFTSGPRTFYSLLSASGVQPLDSIHTFKANIRVGNFQEGDCLSTIAGLLKFSIMIHSLLPVVRDYNFTWFNIIKTIREYKKENLCKTVYITVPEWEKRADFINYFFNYENLLSDVKFIFIVENELEKNDLISTIEKVGCKVIKIEKNSFFKKIDNFLKKIVEKISPQSRSTLLLVNGRNNKKELQEDSKRT